MKRLTSLLFLFALLAPANPAAAASKIHLDVFAAASLTDAFDAIAKQFEKTHPGVHVRTQYAGSQALAAQIEQGAQADVFATADDRWMAYARDRGLLYGEAHTFAHNALVVITPKTNPGRIRKLPDLAKPGLKVIVGAETVPVGAYTRSVLRRMSLESAYGADFGRSVLRNVVSQEENVKSVVGKVQLGEADAGFVYRSDVTRTAGRLLRVIDIPAELNVVANYPIAVVAHSAQAALAREFISLVMSPEGQAMLAKERFSPVAP